MTPIGDFTDTDRILGVMGLTERDLPETQLVSMQIQIELAIELYSWFPDYDTRYDAWYNAGSPVAADQNNIHLLQSFCTFYAAYLVCSGLELFIQISITDSKMQMSRYANLDLDGIRKRMLANSAKAKKVLATAEGIVLPSTTPTLFSSVSPSFDPVTGS